MSLRTVAAKAHNSIIVTDNTNTSRPLKLINHPDREAEAVADPEAGYQPGYVLTFPDLVIYTISKITYDYYRDSLIRANLELVKCNNAVTISRQVAQSNQQGGVSGHVDTVIYTSIPCKILPYSQATDKANDVLLLTYVIHLSNLYPLEVNDKLQFAHTYNVAKAEGIKPISDGLVEISFDRDYRW